MARCVCVPKKKVIPEVGSLNNRVTFYDRDIQPPVGYSTTYGEQLSNSRDIWVNLTPVKDVVTFDDRNVEDRPTHEAWMRYIPDYPIETGKWLEYRGNYFRVVGVSERYVEDEYIHLELKFLGDKNDAINLA